MSEQTLILFCGLHSFAFGFFHLLFPNLLRWKSALAKLDHLNRGVYQILNNQLILVFFGLAIWCLYFGAALLQQTSNRFILGMVAVFWLMRLIQQFIFLKQNHWAMWLLSILFVAGVCLFANAAFF